MTMEKDAELVGVKPRKSRSREVGSRFFTPSSSSPLLDAGTPSLNQALSPVRRKNAGLTKARQHRSLEDSVLARGLWPSLSPGATSSSSLLTTCHRKPDTLADHLGNERLKDLLERKEAERSLKNGASLLYRQRSHSEFHRFENENENESMKENCGASIGGSMRYTGKFRFPGKSSSSSSSSSSSKYSSVSSVVVPGRYSVDDKALSRKAFQQKIDSFSDGLDSESEDSCSGLNDYGGSSLNSRKSGIEVSSKYLTDAVRKTRRWPSDSNINLSPASTDHSPLGLKKLGIKNAIKRTSSLTAGYGRAASQWALSPGRTASQPMTVENKGIPISFSSFKPPTSPSRSKSVGNFLSLGLELFKSKKSSPGTGDSETTHQFRLLHNRLLQWRFVNARAKAVNQHITSQIQVLTFSITLMIISMPGSLSIEVLIPCQNLHFCRTI